jgi:hypothetical protein
MELIHRLGVLGADVPKAQVFAVDGSVLALHQRSLGHCLSSENPAWAMLDAESYEQATDWHKHTPTV